MTKESKAPFVAALLVLGAGAAALLGWMFLRASKAPFDPGFDPFGTITFPDSEEDQQARMILHGAERAYRGGLPETALRFYEDVDLRFSHTAAYAQACEVIWEEMARCHKALGAGAEAAPRYIAARRALHRRWQTLKAGPASKADLEAFLKDLPRDDGRRPRVEALLAK